MGFDNQIVFLNRNGIPMGNFTLPNDLRTLVYDSANRTLYVGSYIRDRNFSSPIRNMTEGNLDVRVRLHGKYAPLTQLE